MVSSASSGSSLEFLNDSCSSVPADGLGKLSLSPESASHALSVETSNNSSTFHGTTPLASVELVDTSSVDCALLSLSEVSSDDLSSSVKESSS